MFESDITWIEALTQLSIVVPFCFLMEKLAGYKKIWKQVPAWFFPAILYTLWNIYNIIVLRYPQILTEIISETAAYKIRAISGLLLMFVVLPCFYKGTVLERYFTCFMLEMISIFGGLFRYACMLLIKKSGLYYGLEHKIFLLLIFRLVIECAPYFLIYFIFRKQFENYRVLVRKHKKVCCMVTILAISLEIITAFMTVSKALQEIWRVIVGSISLFGIIGVAIYLLKRENEQIYLQKQLLENHYLSVKSQEEQVTKMQSEIGKLLEAAETLEKETGYREEDLKYYEAELSKIYSKLQRVDYCDNLMLNAVLHNKAKECEEKNITLDIRMQDIKLGNIPDVDIFEIVYGMLEIAIGQTQIQEDEALRNITISGKNLAGQVVIETIFPLYDYDSEKNVREAKRRDKKQYRRLKRKVKKLKGQCVRNTEGKKDKIIIGIM